jgi:PAS domain S-box-containing protein
MSGEQSGAGPARDRDVEHALRESEHRLQLALAAGDLGAFDLDVTRGITFMSPRVYSIFGYEPGDPKVPRNLQEFFGALHPEDAERVQQAVVAQLEADAPFDAEYRVRKAGGEYAWVHCRARKFVEGDEVRVCGFLRDISARKQAEEHQRQLEAQLRHAQKMETLGTLAGGIAHDFNNLLVPMLGNAEYVLRKADLPAQHRAALQDIVSAALRAKELVQRILVFGRRSDHEFSQRVRVPDVARDALRLACVSLPPAIQIATEIDEGCPEVWGASEQIHQAITNLCLNASQALQRAGSWLMLRVERAEVDPAFATQHAMAVGPAVRVTVEDDGPGMSPEVLQRVFEPFFTTKPTREGVGLGLWMVDAIVTRHGGAVVAHGTVGRGARFELYLPALADTRAASTASPRARATLAAARIVCVDDEPAVLRTLELLMQPAGHDVTFFTSAAAALERVRGDASAVDLVVTDQSMPELTGLDFARRLHALRADLPVIVLSGYAETNDRSESPPNVRLYLRKPVRSEQLLDAVSQVLAGGSR